MDRSSKELEALTNREWKMMAESSRQIAESGEVVQVLKQGRGGHGVSHGVSENTDCPSTAYYGIGLEKAAELTEDALNLEPWQADFL
jgi:hypothetical protein